MICAQTAPKLRTQIVKKYDTSHFSRASLMYSKLPFGGLGLVFLEVCLRSIEGFEFLCRYHRCWVPCFCLRVRVSHLENRPSRQGRCSERPRHNGETNERFFRRLAHLHGHDFPKHVGDFFAKWCVPVWCFRGEFRKKIAAFATLYVI